MSAEANKELVRRMILECQQVGDASRVEEFFAPGFVDHTPLPGIPPTRDGVKALFQGLKAGFPDLRIEIRDQVADETRVVTRKAFLGTHGGTFIGIPASGRPLSFEVIDILKLEGGKVTDHWVSLDRLELLSQLGAMPVPEAQEEAERAA